MFDIGAVELLIIAVVALVAVGPEDLPKMLRTVTGFVRKVREMAREFRMGVEDIAREVEREVDPFKDLREEEGITKDMSPEEITEKIMGNKQAEPDVDSAVKGSSDNDMSAKEDKS